jgi:hypothetical protein
MAAKKRDDEPRTDIADALEEAANAPPPAEPTWNCRGFEDLQRNLAAAGHVLHQSLNPNEKLHPDSVRDSRNRLDEEALRYVACRARTDPEFLRTLIETFRGAVPLTPPKLVGS